jgi:lipoate-protein ligase A
LKNEYAFRFVFTPGLDGFVNMEIDRQLGEVSQPDLTLVRLYTWDMPTISLGCNQKANARVDLNLCQADGIPVVKRPTGGRELLHGHDLCYTVAKPHASGLTAVDAKKIFAEINNSLINALRGMGIDATWNEFRGRPQTLKGPCFAQIDSGEITISGRKLVASAQRVFERCIIQEGSIPLERPTVDLVKYLYVNDKGWLREKIDELTSCLYEHIPRDFTLDSVVDCFRKSFEESYGTIAGPAEEQILKIQGIIATY